MTREDQAGDGAVPCVDCDSGVNLNGVLIDEPTPNNDTDHEFSLVFFKKTVNQELDFLPPVFDPLLKFRRLQGFMPRCYLVLIC